jgi:hypothetical protein
MIPSRFCEQSRLKFNDVMKKFNKFTCSATASLLEVVSELEVL